MGATNIKGCELKGQIDNLKSEFTSRVGSGFQISLDPNPDPVSAPGSRSKRVQKCHLLEEDLKLSPSKNKKGNNFLLEIIIKEIRKIVKTGV